ncbi:MAG: ABC transporter substrate-binding protein [Rhizobiaceae bacterium]
MKALHKAALLGVAIAMGAVTSASADVTKIRWGTEAGYKPFMFKTADGELTGFDYDIGNAICEVLEAECTWTEQAWDGIIPALNARKYDAILASMSITEERKRVVDFTGKYYQVGYRFVGKSDAGLTIEGLEGKTVGVQTGTVTENYLRAERPDITIKAYPTQDEVWLDLAAGRIDAGFANKIVVQDGFISTDKGEGFEMFGPDYTEAKYFGEGTGIAVRKQDGELKEAITKAIAELRASGKYQEINAKYFVFDIYGE